MKKLLIAVCLICQLTNFLFAEEEMNDIKRLMNKVELNQGKPIEVLLLDSIAWEYLYQNPEQAREYALKAVTKANLLEDKKLQGITTLTLGNTYLLVQDYINAEEKYNKVLELNREVNDDKSIGAAYSNLGIIYQEKGLLDTALILHNKSLFFRKKTGLRREIIKSHINIGSIYGAKNQFENAATENFKALKLAEKENNLQYQGVCLNNIGMNYLYLKEHLLAIQNFKASAIIMDSLGANFRLIMNYNNIAETYLELEERDSSIKYANLSLDKNNGLDKRTEAVSFYILGNTYMVNDQLDKAIELFYKSWEIDNALGNKSEEGQSLTSMGMVYLKKEELKEAVENLEKGKELLVASGNLNALKMNQENLIKAKLKIVGLSKLVDSYNSYISLSDTLYSKERFEATNEIEAKFQIEKKETENSLLKKDQELKATTIKNQYLLLGLAGLALLSLGIFWYTTNQQKKGEQQQKRKLADKNKEIQTLNKELSHRVKNNLQFITTLLEMQERTLDDDKAKLALSESQNRLRAMELVHQRLYTEEESTDIEVASYLEDLCADLATTYSGKGTTPKFVLKTKQLYKNAESIMRVGIIINELVTNSFKYAFLHQKSPEIKVELTALENEDLELIYRDNGQGLLEQKMGSGENSLGLKLIHLLTKQLKGEVNMKNDNGAVFQFRFTIPN